jgi:acetolactate synthase-1/2/3 large subunit
MTKRRDSRSAQNSVLARRNFLKAAALGGATLGVSTAAMAQTGQAESVALPSSVPVIPSRAAEHGGPAAPSAPTATAWGSDYMVDVLRALNIEHVASITGNTVKGLHESIINYGMVSEPKLNFLTCMHEEASVAFCHGYAKVAGKPMACMMHSTVGLQHAAMAIYNAFADHVPVICLVGAQMDGVKRMGYVDWQHAVFDGPGLVRDFTKWDDTPMSLGQFSESAVRAYKFAMTPPYGPVVLAVDQGLQLDPVPGGKPPPIPRLPDTTPPQGEDAAVRELARMLVSAEAPVIVADRAARTPEGLRLMVELAEALQAPVVDAYGRFNFPWRHPLNQSQRQRALISKADVVLGLELTDYWDVTKGILPSGAKRVSISSGDLYMKSNYQNFERFTDVDMALAADAEATLPVLVEMVRELTSKSHRSAFEARGKMLAQAHAATLAASRDAAAAGWDDSPISVARMCQELYAQIQNEDWALVNGTVFQSYWPQRLWTADKHHQYIGDAGAYGLGYLPGASLGAAFAHKEHGRLAVAIGGDGDFMFSPGILWSAAHAQIPILYVIHNNRAYHAEFMQVQGVANARNRGVDRVHIGNTITDPNIDFAAMARSMGVYGEGPISDPKDLGPALRRAVAVVKRGEPAIVDVVAQGR